MVVEPRFRPPTYSGAVGIDTDQTRNVETLNVYVEFGKWVDDCTYGLLTLFFFIPSVLVERNTPWRKAR